MEQHVITDDLSTNQAFYSAGLCDAKIEPPKDIKRCPTWLPHDCEPHNSGKAPIQILQTVLKLMSLYKRDYASEFRLKLKAYRF